MSASVAIDTARMDALILRLVARAIRENNPALLEETADDLDRQADELETPRGWFGAPR